MVIPKLRECDSTDLNNAFREREACSKSFQPKSRRESVFVWEKLKDSHDSLNKYMARWTNKRHSRTRMQPTDQISIDLVYPLLLSMISGARYQRVATYSVKKPVWSWSGSATRAKPKSQIFRSHVAFSKRLLGFKSRCKTFAEWMYFRPLYERKSQMFESLIGLFFEI